MKRAVSLIVLLSFVPYATVRADDVSIRTATGAELVTFFETGDVHVAIGEIQEKDKRGLADKSIAQAFAMTTGDGNLVARIAEEDGKLSLAGIIQQQLPGPLVPPANVYTVKDATGEVVTYIDSGGNLFTKGRIFLHGRAVKRVNGVWGGHTADISISDFSEDYSPNSAPPDTTVTATITNTFGTSDAPVTPEDSIQEIIGQLATSIVGKTPPTDAELAEEIKKLETAAAGDRRAIVEQLLYYHGVECIRSGGMAPNLGVGVIVQALKLTESEMREAATPLLPKSNKYWTERINQLLMASVDSKDR